MTTSQLGKAYLFTTNYEQAIATLEQSEVISYDQGLFLAFAYLKHADFSVVLFRPHFMLVSEGYPMKVHKNQWLSTLLSPPNLPCGATNQGTYHGVWGTDAFAVT
jgi:hypothetical protein